MASYLSPKGTEDFFPELWSVKVQIMNSLRATALKYGFLEVETPALETVEWLTKKSGDEILGQIFTLEQRGSERFGLRFDLTVPITRLFLQKQKELQKPVRWFGLSRMWRYEAPQKGRLREFYQLSVECFGSDRVEADVEVLNLFVDCYKNFGLTSNDFKVRINDKKLLEGLLWDCIGDSCSPELVQSLFKIVDKRSKIDDSDFFKELKGAGLSDKQSKTVSDIVSIRGSPTTVIQKLRALNVGERLVQESIFNFVKLFEFLPSEFFEIDLSIARGIAYYTGIVFEAFDVSGEFRALGGGGRYDELVSLYGGDPTPATGFGIGLSTLSLLLEKKGLIPKPLTSVDYYIAPVTEKLLSTALKISGDLRKNNSVVIDISCRSLAKQFSYAQSINAKKVVIVGEKDLADGKVTVRDMITGKEVKMNV
ncbi:histidine--tRNA ligase [Candidatus Woesearchaeota archaeon]|nr:histidine--tRNA ligase [Candidatus Woesearchaeota archaeon]